MSKVTQFSSKEAIQEQASLWISRMDRGLSETEKIEFHLWVKQSQHHRDALFSLASLWDDLCVLNELSALFPLESNQQQPTSRLKKMAIAASVVFAIFTSLLLGFTPYSLDFNEQASLQSKYFKTAVGEQENFIMTDGTSIQLNTNSRVDVAYTRDRRQLTLVYGEAKFDVAKDKSRPFTVNVGEKSFTALGTIFNVQKNTDNDMELVVTEGRVLITNISEAIEKITSDLTLLSPDLLPGILVESGEKAVIENNSPPPVEKVSLDQVQRDLAWQQGMLIFNGEPLAQALKEVSRYTNIHFEIASDELANIKVAGYFKAGDIDGLLQSLNFNFNIEHQKIADNSIRLLEGSSQ